MIHQTVSLGKYWKLFPATLNKLTFSSSFGFINTCILNSWTTTHIWTEKNIICFWRTLISKPLFFMNMKVSLFVILIIIYHNAVLWTLALLLLLRLLRQELAYFAFPFETAHLFCLN